MKKIAGAIRDLSPSPRGRAVAAPDGAGQENSAVHVGSRPHLNWSEKRALSKFSAAWSQAMDKPDDEEARQDLLAALSAIAPSTKDSAGVQETVARCISSACERWQDDDGAALDFIAQLCNQLQQHPLDLSLAADHQVSALTDLLGKHLLQTPDVAFLRRLSQLHGLLPAASKLGLDRDLSNFISLACDIPGKFPAEKINIAMECIKDPYLQSMSAVAVMGGVVRKYPGWLKERVVFDPCRERLAKVAPLLAPEHIASIARRLLNYIDTPGIGYEPQSHLSSACLLTLAHHPRADLVVELIPKLLRSVPSGDSHLSAVDIFEAAIRLADDGQVGVEFHEFVAEVRGERMPLETMAKWATLSFHLDPSPGRYYETELHEPVSRTVQINYPDWLHEARGVVSGIWGVLSQGEAWRAEIGRVLVSNADSLHLPNDMKIPAGIPKFMLIDKLAGPSVRAENWPVLEKAFVARVRAL